MATKTAPPAAGTEIMKAPGVSAEELALIKQTVAYGATDAELKLYLYDCQRRGVHPLDRLLHFTKRGGKYVPVTSIDLMRARAAETGEMAGSDDARFQVDEQTGQLLAASVRVYRLTQTQRFSYTATARWAEYCPDNAPMWRRMPHTMLGKCAEALALRKAFPAQLAGLYATEELDQAGPGPIEPAPRAAVGPVIPLGGAPAEVIPPQTRTSRGGAVIAEDPEAETYALINSVEQTGQWFNVRWRDNLYKTKIARIGRQALDYYEEGRLVICRSERPPWLDAIDPAPSTPSLLAVEPPEGEQPF